MVVYKLPPALTIPPRSGLYLRASIGWDHRIIALYLQSTQLFSRVLRSPHSMYFYIRAYIYHHVSTGSGALVASDGLSRRLKSSLVRLRLCIPNQGTGSTARTVEAILGFLQKLINQ